MKIGSHVSISGGLLGAAMEAFSYGANTFMIYTGAPQNTKRISTDKMKVEEGREFMKNNGFEGFIVHAPYIINLASYKENIYDLAKTFLLEEIKRTSRVGSAYLVLHPGAYTDKDFDYGVKRIADGLNFVLEEDFGVTVLLETMAGKGTEIGRTFYELRAIIDACLYKERLGVCLDTCHVHDSGMDIVNGFDAVLDDFDKIIGLSDLKVLHINGSLNERGAKKDRHANIGAGEDNPKGSDKIGFDAIYNIVHSERLKDRFFILETPWLDEKTNLYKDEIAALRG